MTGDGGVLTGRCLCRAVRWRAEGAPAWQAHCHCESCRRATSAGVATFVAVPRAGFAWEGDAPAAFASSPGVVRRFCGRCGSPLSYETEAAPDEVHLHAATLDDPALARPTRHDFWAERVPWLALDDRSERG